MSWFEQGTSNARCIIIQFHRPAELKLKRMCRSVFTPVCSPDIREFFYFDKEVHTVDYSHSYSYRSSQKRQPQDCYRCAHL